MIFKRVDDVVRWRLCTGCGACAAICPEQNLRMIDILSDGLRPVVGSKECLKCGRCVSVCPGVEISHQPFNGDTISQLRQSWGPVLEVWEGYAVDPKIRFEGSSGGVATALALYCLEEENYAGTLHVSADLNSPLKNIPVFSRSREELLKSIGSRYSPAAPCEKLKFIGESDFPCVFIGKPCDVVALCKSQKMMQGLNNKAGLVISIFCAGTPNSLGTYKLLEAMGVKAEEVVEIRYRGHGWPGATTVKMKNNDEIHQMTYKKSWGSILSKYSQFRCRLCPDSTGEFADISCGDPWYRDILPGEQGRSLVLVRTKRGKNILERAKNADYLMLEPANIDVLALSQKSLLKRRKHLWGRLLAMQIMRIPIPSFKGFSLYSNWQNLSFSEKFVSIAGTFKRIFHRNLVKPSRVYTKDSSLT